MLEKSYFLTFYSTGFEYQVHVYASFPNHQCFTCYGKTSQMVPIGKKLEINLYESFTFLQNSKSSGIYYQVHIFEGIYPIIVIFTENYVRLECST